jgi:hypothetical protein
MSGIEGERGVYGDMVVKLMLQAAASRLSWNEPHLWTLRIYLNNVQLGFSQGRFQSLEALVSGGILEPKSHAEHHIYHPEDR